MKHLLRGAATADELIVAINRDLGEAGFPEQALHALRNDLRILRTEYGCTIRLRHRRYELLDLGELALLDSLIPERVRDILEQCAAEHSSSPQQGLLKLIADRMLLLIGRNAQRHDHPDLLG